METDPYVTAGPEDEFEPDWGAGPGAAGLELLPWHEAEPADRGTMELRHRSDARSALGHGHRRKVWLPPRCGGQGGHDDGQPWRHQRAHHQPGRRFRHRAEAQGFLAVLGIRGADRVSRGQRPLWPCPPWHAWRGPGVQTLSSASPTFRTRHASRTSAPRRKGRPCFCRSLPCMPAAGSPNPVGHHRTAVALSDLGEVGC